MLKLRPPFCFPSAWLLLAQLAGILIYPWLEDTATGRAIFGVIGLLVLGAALWVVRRSPGLNWVGLLLALPVVVIAIINAVRFDPNLVMLANALKAVFYLYATGSLIAYMTTDLEATADEIFATVATFTLLAWAFAYLFALCQALIPGSFTGMISPGEPRTWMELLFLSFSTLSSVGIGDILPIKPLARSLVMLESLAGVMYIALVVSRLIGLTVLGRR